MVKHSKFFSQINSSPPPCQTTPKLLASKPVIENIRGINALRQSTVGIAHHNDLS
ncbi:hypothetical protein [Nostoc sp.]|uniref:hypothetical protein n=1 Tax=Nostoc sp. TaxID=1180 RepID=UPI002FFD3231